MSPRLDLVVVVIAAQVDFLRVEEVVGVVAIAVAVVAAVVTTAAAVALAAATAEAFATITAAAAHLVAAAVTLTQVIGRECHRGSGSTPEARLPCGSHEYGSRRRSTCTQRAEVSYTRKKRVQASARQIF